MKRSGAYIMVSLLAFAMCAIAGAKEKKVVESKVQPVPLWANGAPGAMGSAEQDIPVIYPYLLPKDGVERPAVIVCPGGGYAHHAMGYEGFDVAEMLNKNGVNAFVLRYRVAPYKHPVPLGDAQRAIRTVRANAKEWGIAANGIGILGFSAGGHLSSTTGTHFDAGNPASDDPIERVSSRPDFMVLIYGVLTMRPPFGHAGSCKNLLGDTPSEELLTSLCNDEQVTKETPPAFIVASTADTGVPAENSIQFYLAMRKAGVPAELHVYEKGQHGFGMGVDDPSLGTWPPLCIEWMKLHGFIK